MKNTHNESQLLRYHLRNYEQNAAPQSYFWLEAFYAKYGTINPATFNELIR